MNRELRLEDLQSFEDFASPYPVKESKPEKRRWQRYAFRTEGSLIVNGPALEITTADVSAGGLSINVARQIGVGMEGNLSFILATASESCDVLAQVRIVYCFHSGDGTYKAGLEILKFMSGADEFQRFLLAAGQSR